MLLHDAAEAVGEVGGVSITEAEQKFFLAQISLAFWHIVWPRIRDERLKVHIWVFSPSVRISALKPFFEQVFGKAPDGN